MNYMKELTDLNDGSKKAIEKVTRISEMITRMYGGNFLDESDKGFKDKFMQQRALLIAAIKKLDPVSINKHCLAMLKAYKLLDEQLTQKGTKKIPSEKWQVSHAGYDYVIVRTDAELPRKTDIVMASVEEMLRALPTGFHEIKKQFPGASVTEDFIDDEIPF
tara:strand:- start:3061 stop:3546 length:486 start_codon:yes stop_codon:yes gene_type:complete